MGYRIATSVFLCVIGAFAETPPDPNPNPNRTTGFASDANGNSFIAIAGQNKVYKLNSAGELSLYAGTGEAGFKGDNVPASAAQLNAPWGLFLDAPGNLYIADAGNARLRKVDAGTGAITTVAGNGVAQLNTPLGLTANGIGNLLIADVKDASIRMIAADSGLMGTVPLDDGIAPLVAPYGLVTDATGTVLAADTGNVYKLDSGKLKRASPGTVSLSKSGVFYAPALRQIAYPLTAAALPLSAEVEWVPAACPPPGTNPGSEDCVASARLIVDLRRLPAKSTLEVKPFGISDTVAVWKLEEISFTTLTGAGTVALMDAPLPITLSTMAGPMPVDMDIPISVVRVKMTVNGSVQINASTYKFSLTGDLFP